MLIKCFSSAKWVFSINLLLQSQTRVECFVLYKTNIDGPQHITDHLTTVQSYSGA